VWANRVFCQGDGVHADGKKQVFAALRATKSLILLSALRPWQTNKRDLPTPYSFNSLAKREKTCYNKEAVLHGELAVPCTRNPP